MKLPISNDEFFRQVARTLEKEDSMNHKRDRDLDVGANRLILTSPGGIRFEVRVQDNGQLTTIGPI